MILDFLDLKEPQSVVISILETDAFETDCDVSIIFICDVLVGQSVWILDYVVPPPTAVVAEYEKKHFH